MDIIRKIIKEEFEYVLDKTYSIKEVSDAIKNKHFIHIKNGKVYSPVSIKKDCVIGVNNDCQHVSIPIDKITMIQSAEDRFQKV